jgi:AcrR family transcriptional regulator
LVDATLRLLVTRPVAGVSVRDIAAEAGVNHGLVHRHFGSKDALVRAAVERAARTVYGDDTPARASWFFERLREHPELAILVARACLDGPAELLAIAAPPRALLDEIAKRLGTVTKRLGPIGVDTYTANSLWTCAMLGWFVFRPMIDRGYHLPAHADDNLARAIAGLDALVDGLLAR